jgi:hypothetical protein
MKALTSLILAAGIFLSGCGGNTATPQPGIVFVGDSIFGRLSTNATFKQAGYINGGVFGQRTDQILAGFQDVISGKSVCHGFQTADGTPDPVFPYSCSPLPVPPQTVVIFAGWNNLFQGNPGNTALSDIESMAHIAKLHGVKAVICTLYAFDPGHPAPWMVPTGNAPVTFYDGWRDPLNDGLRAIPGVSIVDLSQVFQGQSDYTIDGVHPTDQGNNQLLSSIMQQLN